MLAAIIGLRLDQVIAMCNGKYIYFDAIVTFVSVCVTQSL